MALLKRVTLAALVLCIIPSLAVAKKRYDGYKLYSVVPTTRTDFQLLYSLVDEHELLMQGTNTGQAIDIAVPPTEEGTFQKLLRDHGLHAELVIDNLQNIIDMQMASLESRPKALEWTNYHTLEEIYEWLDGLAAKNPNVYKVVAGVTYENRTIQGVQIINGQGLPGVILESGIHAREWIGPAATSWIVNEIINSPANSTWRKFNYQYFPNLNPDGYVYTWTDDRLWRKTRKPYANGCFGADPNRNFDNHWLEGNGASTNPCSETYAGPEPFSEVETKSFSEYLKFVGVDYDIYFAFHSAAQLILFPWGWTPDPAPLHDLWQRVGDDAAAEIAKVNGTIFEVGDTYNTIYPASATSVDWYYGVFNSTLTFTFEMRSGFGFVLPPEYIVPCGKEHLAGLLSLLNAYLKL